MMEAGINLTSKIGVEHEIIHDGKLHVALEHEARFKE